MIIIRKSAIAAASILAFSGVANGQEDPKSAVEMALRESPLSGSDNAFPAIIKMSAPFVIRTIGYWAGGTRSDARACVDVPSMKSYEIVTIEKEERVAGRGACQVPPLCDSHGEFCADVRVSIGCWVRRDVYNWYLAELNKQKLSDLEKDVLCNRLS
jgi:hypothetical protein